VEKVALPSIQSLGRIGGNLEEPSAGIIHLRVEVRDLLNAYQECCALYQNVQFGASQFTSADFSRSFKK
jgi:hypothetical protein